MKKYLVLFCIIFNITVYSQSTFSVLYGLENDLELFHDIYENNDTLVMVFTDSNIDYYDDEPGLVRNVMMKMNNEGNVLMFKPYYDPDNLIGYFSNDNNISPTVDGGFVTAIYLRKRDTTLTTNYYSLSRRAMIMRFDSNLDTIWTRTIGADWADSIIYTGAAAVELNDYYYLWGSRFLDDEIQAMLVKFNSQGDLIWLKYYDLYALDEWAINLMTTDDNTLIATGFVYDVFQNSVPRDDFVIEFDEDGEVLQSRFFDWNEDGGSSPGTAVLSDGSLIVNNILDVSTYNIERLNISENFEVEWSDEFVLDESSNTFNYHGIAEDDDGNIITVGSTFTNELGGHGFMRKYTPEGNVLWTRRYRHVDYLYAIQELYNVTATSDGGYAACGQVAASAIGIVADGWIIKVDSMGCLVPGCDTLVGIGEMESELQNEWFSFGPNPIKKGQSLNVFYVGNNTQGLKATAIHRFVLTNTNGQIVNEFETDDLSTTYLVNTQNLSAGLYVLSFYEGSRVLQSEKVVIVE